MKFYISKTRISAFFKSLYTKYVIKYPVFAIIIMIIGFVSLFFIVKSTNTDVFRTFDAKVTINGSVSKQIEVTVPMPDGQNITGASRVFWYTDKKSVINTAENFDVVRNDEAVTLTITPEGKAAAALTDGLAVKVDIAVYKQTLLSRIFGKGVQKIGIK